MNINDMPGLKEIELNYQVARLAFDKELCRIKECLSKAIPVGQASIILEDTSDDRVHKKMAKKRLVESQDRLMKTKERSLKGKG